MLRQRKLRDRLVAMAAPPIVVAAAVAATSAVLLDGESGQRVALVGLAATLLVTLWSVIVGGAVLRSLSALAIEASGMADAQRRVADGDLAIEELPPLGYVGPADELGRVADAIDAMARTSVEVAESQRRSIREGLATIVINLARRNQSLLDRQVEYLDALEQSEEDPDRLAELFRVDHLATRMRRNAESLLVLAGAEPGKRRGNPVTVSDVLRVAIGEVENYQHIELGAIDDGEVPAGVAVDLAHLTAELMENATQFSPPSAPVEVSAIRHAPSGTYRVSITDQGMGLGERLDHANQTLANPPELGLGMGRSLGFMVVGRLAQRLRATVRLDSNEGGGTIAEVELPLAVLQGHEPPATSAPPPSAPSPTSAGAEPAPDPATSAAATPDPAADEAPVASTTLEKLLGITPGGPTPSPDVAGPVGPAPIAASTPGASGPVASPGPAVEPGGPDSPEWQHQSPFAPGATSVDRHPSSAPIPPDGPATTWGDLQDDRPAGPEASDGGWTQPPVTPPPATQHPATRQSASDHPATGYPTSDDPATQHPATQHPVTGYPATQLPATGYPVAQSPSGPATTPASAGHAPPGDPSPPTRFDEAVPSGDAFESGVNSLLHPPAPTEDATSSGLRRRQRGASNVPIGEGRPVAAPSRSPEEVRAMLARYRDGLKDGRRRPPATDPGGGTPHDRQPTDQPDDRNG